MSPLPVFQTLQQADNIEGDNPSTLNKRPLFLSNSFNFEQKEQTSMMSSPLPRAYMQANGGSPENESKAHHPIFSGIVTSAVVCTNQNSIALSPEQYRVRKEQVREVFISKDELFKKVSQRFKTLLKAKGKRIDRKKAELSRRLESWDKAEAEIKSLAEEIRLNNQQQQHQFGMLEASSEKRLNQFLQSHSSRGRKIWKSREPKIAKRQKSGFSSRPSTANILIRDESQLLRTEPTEDSDECNVQDEEDEAALEKAKLEKGHHQESLGLL